MDSIVDIQPKHRWIRRRQRCYRASDARYRLIGRMRSVDGIVDIQHTHRWIRRRQRCYPASDARYRRIGRMRLVDSIVDIQHTHRWIRRCQRCYLAIATLTSGNGRMTSRYQWSVPQIDASYCGLVDGYRRYRMMPRQAAINWRFVASVEANSLPCAFCSSRPVVSVHRDRLLPIVVGWSDSNGVGHDGVSDLDVAGGFLRMDWPSRSDPRIQEV